MSHTGRGRLLLVVATGLVAFTCCHRLGFERQPADGPTGGDLPAAGVVPVLSFSGVDTGSFDGTQWNSISGGVAPDGSQVWEINGSWFDTSGLAGYWPLDESPANEIGAATIADATSFGNDGTLSTGDGSADKQVTGKIRGALDFDGANDYVNIGNPTQLQITGPMSITAWVISMSNDDTRIITKEGGPGERGWSLSTDVGATYSVMKIAVSVDCVQFFIPVSRTEMTFGHWYHLAYVYVPGTSIRLYVNGWLDTEVLTGVPSGQCDPGTEVNIGRRHDGILHFTGQIDDVAVWDRALAPSEVDLIYDRQAPTATGTYTSEIFDAQTDVRWESLQVVPRRPTGKEIPTQGDSGYAEGNLDTTGLVALWHLNGRDGELVVGSSVPEAVRGMNNTVPNDADGTMRYAEGWLREAIYFAGGDDHLDAGNDPSLDLTAELSIAAWIRPTTPGQAQKARIVDRGAFMATLVTGYTFSLQADGRLVFARYIPNDWDAATSAAYVIQLGQWQHVVATYASGTVVLYVNGVSVGGGSIGPIAPGTESLFIGARGEDLQRHFDGFIDEVAVFDQPLSATQVRDLYLRGALRMRVSVRTCADPTCGGAPFVALTQLIPPSPPPPGAITYALDSLPVARALQYQVVFASHAPAVVPELTDVRITASLP